MWNLTRIGKVSAVRHILQNGVQKVPPEGLPLLNLSRIGSGRAVRAESD